MAADVLKYAIGNSASTTSSSSVSNSDTAVPLTSDTNFQAESGEGMVLIDEGQAAEEIAYSTGLSGSSLTVPLANRGLEGGSAQAHSSGASVKGILTAGMWNDLINALVDNVLVKATGVVKAGLALTSPKVTTGINDSNDNELLKVTATASAVNELTLANAAAGSSPVLSATGSDTDIDIVQTAKGAGQHKISMRIQKDTTSSTVSGVSTQVGWGFITGNGSATRLNESVTFPTAFANEVLGVSINFIGMKQNSDPTAITEFVTTTDDDVEYRCYGMSTTGFTAEAESDAALASINRYGYFWVAYGR